MKKINLKFYYSFIYKSDKYIEVSDEILEVLKRFERQMHACYERRRFHKAYYSLNADDGIERFSIYKEPSPEEIIEDKIKKETLYKAMQLLTEKQMKRIYAHFFLGLGYSKIAKIEGVNKSVISRSIISGLKNLKKHLENFEK